jgi:hypothetical protein
VSEAAASSCGKRVPWVDGRFHVTNDALKQNKKTPPRRSNPKNSTSQKSSSRHLVNKAPWGSL